MTPQHERIRRVIQAYDAQGWHRTGTETDHHSAVWLAEQVQDCGLTPGLESFPLRRIEPQRSAVEIAGQCVQGLPLFDGAFTGPEGVSGRLGPLGAGTEIGLTEVPPHGAVPAFEAARRGESYQSLVALTVGHRAGLAPRNAWDFTAPFGAPVLQVGSDARAWLAAHAAQRSAAHVVVHVEYLETEAYNVIATLPGQHPDLPPLVVMTPRSGWWHCAGERGGGLACWLEAMRTLRERRVRRDVLFLASSGHELGHLGLEVFLAQRPGLATGAVAWIHLGASIGAAHAPQLVRYASDHILAELTRTALTQQQADPVAVAPHGTLPGGEARNIHERGGRYVSLAGGNALFHLEADRWPTAVKVSAVAQYATAFAQLAVWLAEDASAVL